MRFKTTAEYRERGGGGSSDVRWKTVPQMNHHQWTDKYVERQNSNPRFKSQSDPLGGLSKVSNAHAERFSQTDKKFDRSFKN